MRISSRHIGACLLLCARQTYTITLLQVLESYSDLSILNSYVKASTNATEFLSNANNNFTFLAPSNAAIASFALNNPNVLIEDLLQAALQLSLLQGGYPTLSFADTVQFVASNLDNSSYVNVTGGQRVELVSSRSGTAQILTGNKSISASTLPDIICTGGIVHIVDAVPSIPASAVTEITEANWEYTVSILTVGEYLNVENTYVNQVLGTPDVTFFIPNSAAALSTIKELVKNSSADDLRSIFEYHVVPGFVGYSNFLMDGMILTTTQGDNVTVTVQDGETYINAAQIIAADYIVANGVVHVIDSLLNRLDTSGPPAATSPASTRPSAFSATGTSTTSTATSAPVSHSRSHSSSITTGIAVGVAVGTLAFLSALLLYLLSRANRCKRAAARNEESFGTLRTPSTAGERGGGIYVQQDIHVHRQPNPDSVSPLRVQTTGEDRFQSKHYWNLTWNEPEIRSESPNMAIKSGREFF